MSVNTYNILFFVLIIPRALLSQDVMGSYYAGFRTYQLTDKSRTYKPNTGPEDSLHNRPVDLDIWYPFEKQKDNSLLFGDLFKLLEERAIRYQDQEDYTGMTDELAQFLVTEMGIEGSGEDLLKVRTESYSNLEGSKRKHPLIVYMAGLNGMGFENYKVFEKLAQNGFVVVSVWSVGRYPGDMTNKMEDMMEQVYDAEFAIKCLRESTEFKVDFTKIGVLGCSWGGMSAAVLVNRNSGISAMVSFDGTETAYFGAPGESESDGYIKDIQSRQLLNPEGQAIRYMYLESGDKLGGFTPTSSYHYFERLNSEKYYLRYLDSHHADFTSIPSILEVSDESVWIYSSLAKVAVLFFDKFLKGNTGFTEYFEYLRTLPTTTDKIYGNELPDSSHIEISGKVIDSRTKEPLSYVNIGLQDKEIGSVTNTKGIFVLSLGEEMLEDTIRVSMIGYEPEIFVVKDKFGNEMYSEIEMEEKVSKLDEVVVTAKAYKTKTLGNITTSRFLSTGFSYNQLGAEIGTRINIRNRPVYVEAFNFNISYNRLSAKSIFRLRFYKIENGRPSDDILKENILIPIEPKEIGVKSINLEEYNIMLTGDVIVALEWVDKKGENNDGEAIFFSLALLSNGTLYKASSQTKYKKHSSLGVGFNIDVKY